jgi:hypothetical protein
MITEKDKKIIQVRATGVHRKRTLIACFILIALLSMEIALLIFTIVFTCKSHGIEIDHMLPRLIEGMKLNSSYTGVEAALFLTFEELKIVSILLLGALISVPLIVLELNRDLRIYQCLKEAFLQNIR